MRRRILWISALVAVVAVAAAVSWISRKPAAQDAATAAPASTSAGSTATLPPNSTPKPGAVLLVEYSDFECPSCALMFPLVEGIRQEYAGRIDFVFREFPLRQIHANAEPAAWAAEAAGQQGKFWEMADLLFKNQAAWSGLPNPMPAFEQYARMLGLDLDRFRSDFSSFVVRSKVNNDVRLGMEDQIRHTPTVFLNGREIRPQNYAQFREYINAALAAAGK